MLTVTTSQMRDIDTYCIKNLGIPGIVLMENAALKIVRNIDLSKNNSFVVVCGVGNNGGDGLAVARHLFALGKDVKVFIIGNLNKMTEDFKINYRILKNLRVKLYDIKENNDLYILSHSLCTSDVTIDAIFGTGLKRKIEGIYRNVISLMNKKSFYIISVDIPSGLNGDTGNVLNICVKAHKTITFQLMKKGLINDKCKQYIGKIIVEPIGMPKIAIEKVLNK